MTCENIKDIIGCTIFEVEDLPIITFFNYVTYVTYKNKRIEQQYKQK